MDSGKFCSKCNNVNGVEAKYCSSCGANISEMPIVTAYTGEETETIVNELKRKLFSGRFITFEDCNFLLACIDDEECIEGGMKDVEKILKTICTNYVQKKLSIELNFDNWETPIVKEYEGMIVNLVGFVTAEPNMYNFLKEIVRTSENIEAMWIISAMEYETDYPDHPISKRIKEIKELAAKRYSELTGTGKKKWWQ